MATSVHGFHCGSAKKEEEVIGSLTVGSAEKLDGELRWGRPTGEGKRR
jgi:hypothetical protein